MYLKVRSRNKSANKLRKQITVNKPTVLRLGSFTENEKIFKKRTLQQNNFVEINTVEACKTSNDKRLMKAAFEKNNVKTSKWAVLTDFFNEPESLRFPCIIKKYNSSRGQGIFLVNSMQDINRLNLVDPHKYIIEEYKTYSREYRLHVDEFGCFLTHRKLLRTDAEDRWHRHHSNTVWIVETNPLFDKPSNWDEIVQECQKAIKAVGLQIGCVDIKVQTRQFEHPNFIILETNSAPALGDETAELYKQELIKIINK